MTIEAGFFVVTAGTSSRDGLSAPYTMTASRTLGD